MVNRIVKKSNDGDVNDLIRIFLVHKDEATFGEIAEHLKEKGIKYKQKRGLYYRLDKLIDKGTIQKIEYQRSDPTYCLSSKGRKGPSTSGLLLKYQMIDELEKIQLKMNRDDFLRFMTLLIGVYSSYVEILSYRLFRNEKSLEKRLKNRQEFLQEALPLMITGQDWYNTIEIFGEDKTEEIYSRLSSDLEKLEKDLEKISPELVIFCRHVTRQVGDKLIRMADLAES